MDVKIELGSASEENEEKEYSDYDVDCAVKCLIEAEEIKKNEKLWPLVVEKLQTKKEAINSLADLRKIASKKSSED